MAMYLVMTIFFSRLLRLMEKKLDGPDSYVLATKIR
jgi:ABC-type amino acid transport system permease subunit